MKIDPNSPAFPVQASAILEQTEADSRYIDWIEGMDCAPGHCYRGLPNETYHRGPGISKSGLDDIDVSPVYYLTRKQHPQPPTPTLLLGSAFHAAVLEPERFARDFVPDPFPGSRAKDALAAREALAAAGKTVIKHEPNPDTIWDRGDWDTLRYMRDAVLAHPDASIYLAPEDGFAELSCYWVDPTTHRLAKCRHDYWNAAHRLIIDLKSIQDATLSGFQRSTHEYRYDVQAAWYLDGTRLTGKLAENMIFIACEKKPPYHIGCYEIDAEWVRQGRAKYQVNLRAYDACMQTQTWPGLPDETRILPIPGYAKFNPIS